MMTNLFSVFDPSSSIVGLPLNWFSMFIGLGVMPLWYWMTPSRSLFLFKQLYSLMYREMELLLGKGRSSWIMMFLALFMFIVLNNSAGLLPWVFTASSHLVFTVSLALPLWLGYFLMGWATNLIHMLAHLVPHGTPGALMPFMVLIESVSSLIRPGTLAVRLAANMIAGHLLLTLLSGAISLTSVFSMITILMSQIALLMLEVAVAVIQSYVFAILSSLYASEV
uniref:ATP synthase subunit a n=1 Tax=Sphaeroma terebrans TaxID=180402 RepID=A0A5J6NN95_SPHTE|nr:ATP synthase F0 subunit 6 [Sphaeroma terebrans]